MKYLILLCLISPLSFASCFEEVSDKYRIHEKLLRAIAYTESRYVGDAVNCRNSNKSCDYGFAQINLSEWETKLKEFDISLLDLQDPCQNLHFGGWVLAMNFKTHGRNWNSVGAYNAGFSKKRKSARAKYIALVKMNLRKIESGQIQ